MGQEMNIGDERNTKVFNTPIEIGLRVLFLLNKFYPTQLSLESLIYLDYFLVHSQDIKNGPTSLHPKYPFRSTEIIIKREVLKNGLYYLLSKELIHVNLLENGIKYSVTKIANYVIAQFESKYAATLNERCEWLFSIFGQHSEGQLKDIVDTNLEKWGGEFVNESKFRNL